MSEAFEKLKNRMEGAAFIAGGTAVGTGVSAAVGGMGLVGGFGGVAIGTAPVLAAGAVVGSAAYGSKKAIEQGDSRALGAAVGGAAAGTGVSLLLGEMGLAVGGAAFAIGAAPVAVVGAVVGLGAYGLARMCDRPQPSPAPSQPPTAQTTAAQAFDRTAASILRREREDSALQGTPKSPDAEVEWELRQLKAELQRSGEQDSRPDR